MMLLSALADASLELKNWRGKEKSMLVESKNLTKESEQEGNFRGITMNT